MKHVSMMLATAALAIGLLAGCATSHSDEHGKACEKCCKGDCAKCCKDAAACAKCFK